MKPSDPWCPRLFLWTFFMLWTWLLLGLGFRQVCRGFLCLLEVNVPLRSNLDLVHGFHWPLGKGIFKCSRLEPIQQCEYFSLSFYFLHQKCLCIEPLEKILEKLSLSLRQSQKASDQLRLKLASHEVS